MDVTEFKKLIEKEKNINVEENKMNNQDNQKIEMKNKILESLNGLTVSERTLSFDKKTNKSDLCKTLKNSSSTMAKMTNEEKDLLRVVAVRIKVLVI